MNRRKSKALALREDAIPYRTDGAVTDRKLRFIDLFCGIGGFRIAFDKAGRECVFSSDWDKHAQIIYAANFGQTPHGDIHTIAVGDIPPFDILCAGFPCQPFSIAGVSKKLSLDRKHGFEDEKQGNVFFDIAAILNHHQPPAFVLENVKHLLRHDKGRMFEIIYRTLTESFWLGSRLTEHLGAVFSEKIQLGRRRVIRKTQWLVGVSSKVLGDAAL